MADLLARLAGPNWEADFLGPSTSALPPSLATASASAANASFASPALRAKIGPRPSLLGTSRGTGLALDSPRPAGSSGDVLEEDEGEGEGGEAEEAAAGAGDQVEAVAEQLEAVQALIRGMQERMLKRDGELDGIERRAREEAGRAAERGREVGLMGGVAA